MALDYTQGRIIVLACAGVGGEGVWECRRAGVLACVMWTVPSSWRLLTGLHRTLQLRPFLYRYLPLLLLSKWFLQRYIEYLNGLYISVPTSTSLWNELRLVEVDCSEVSHWVDVLCLEGSPQVGLEKTRCNNAESAKLWSELISGWLRAYGCNPID